MTIASIAATNSRKIRTTAVSCLLAMMLSGCLGDDESGGVSRLTGAPDPIATGEAQVPAPGSPTSNSAPTISGTPPTSAAVNQAYSYQPTASDADGDQLTFTVTNKPAWATFDPATGRLSGTPSSSSSGTFADIRITVSDGKATASLSPFSISVASLQAGSATLRWQPPTSNTDGSPLTNLAGYVIRYGTSLDKPMTEVRVGNPGLTTYVVSELAPATWYFHVAAYNTAGVESAPSATGSKTIG